jgi:hypothetical protein
LPLFFLYEGNHKNKCIEGSVAACREYKIIFVNISFEHMAREISEVNRYRKHAFSTAASN